MFFQYRNELIHNDCLARIKETEKGKYQLTVFKNKRAVFEKEYNTMKSAKTQQTKLINKLF